MARLSFYYPKYKEKQAQITHQNWVSGRFDFRKKPLDIRVCANKDCTKKFGIERWELKRFCSRSCSAHTNNTIRKRAKKYSDRRCIECHKLFTRRHNIIYCSLRCQRLHSYNRYIIYWTEGLVDGAIGISTRSLSGYIKRYLHEQFHNQCVHCGWNQKHPVTQKIPLEINHIDGNTENNLEENLELLCPNCHSLTPNFRNLNKGNGRKWRLHKNRASTVIKV